MRAQKATKELFQGLMLWLGINKLGGRQEQDGRKLAASGLTHLNSLLINPSLAPAAAAHVLTRKKTLLSDN